MITYCLFRILSASSFIFLVTYTEGFDILDEKTEKQLLLVRMLVFKTPMLLNMAVLLTEYFIKQAHIFTNRRP